MDAGQQQGSLLATTGLVLSILPWIIVVAALFYGAIDIRPESDEALKQFLRHQAHVVVSLVSIASCLVGAAIWISGLSFERARLRSLITLCSCMAFIVTGLYVYVQNNLRAL